ncbi:MAG: phage tail family protein [Bacillota bacterium]|nr:phage tail family protein [Bacillota bacterium]
MIYGLTFNGKHSYNDFGLVMQSKNRPLLPEPKIVTDEAACMDGEYDYTDANPDGRAKYKSVTHEITFDFDRTKVNCRNPQVIRNLAHDIAKWLSCGEQILIYDDEVIIYHQARVINKIDLEPQIQAGRPFTVQFKCRPYGYLIKKSTDSMSDLEDYIGTYGIIEGMTPAHFTVTGNQTLTLYNPGTFVKPLVRITGSGSNITLSLGGKTFRYFGTLSSETLVIDFDKMQALKGLLNVMSDCDGGMLELNNGNNSLSISGTSLNCTVDVEFRALYL